MAGEDARFWADPSCIQCRAQLLLDNPDEYRQMIYDVTGDSDSMRMARRLLDTEQSQTLHDESVLVGYRKGRAELHSILLDPHECGKADG